ncbi:MAG: hypothetical protein V1743_05870 [Nanoarchaeota archaeon]
MESGITNEPLRVHFSQKEISQLLFAIFAFSIVFFLIKWRSTDFTKTTGVMYFIFVFIIVFLFMFLMVYIQKRTGLRLGYHVEYQNSLLYLVIGVFVTFLFLGYVFILVTGEAILTMHPRLRTGQFRSHLNVRDAGFISIIGALFGFGLFIVLIILYALSKDEIILEAIKIILLISLFILVPAPKNNGLAAFRWSRIILLSCFFVLVFSFGLTFLSEPSLILGYLAGGFLLLLIGVIEVLPRIFYGA